MSEQSSPSRLLYFLYLLYFLCCVLDLSELWLLFVASIWAEGHPLEGETAILKANRNKRYPTHSGCMPGSPLCRNPVQKRAFTPGGKSELGDAKANQKKRNYYDFATKPQPCLPGSCNRRRKRAFTPGEKSEFTLLNRVVKRQFFSEGTDGVNT